jgi:small subunit ribosomal protein S1
MKEILTKNNFLKPPKVGDIVKGKVVSKNKASLFFDLGSIGTGIVYGKEFLEAKNIIRSLKPGDEVFVKIIELKGSDGYIELSLNKAGQDIAWKEIKEKKDKGEIIKIKINNANKGGLLAEFAGIQGFLPVSQLSQKNYPKVEGGDTNKIFQELQKFVGKEMEVKIYDFDPKENKLIFSERSIETEKVKEVLKKYKIGDVVEVTVSGIVDFGAFVKLGNDDIEGLIHISELDWKIIDNPTKIVKVGDKIKAKIVNINEDRIFLSLKALKDDPWKNIESKYKKGDIIKGKVTRLNPFGAFVQISEEIQGLCHISEFNKPEEMEEKLKVGESYNFEIVDIKPSEHRMSLKLAQKS